MQMLHQKIQAAEAKVAETVKDVAPETGIQTKQEDGWVPVLKVEAEESRKRKREEEVLEEHLKKRRKIESPFNKRHVFERPSLPVDLHVDDIRKMVKENPVCVITGETGSGKSTQIAQILSRDFKNIVVTQPRRVGAVTLAQRVSEELGVECGKEVGFVVRFSKKTTRKTKIRYATDGCLLREVLHDRILKDYDCVILDEAHERSLGTDILFAVLRNICKKRSDFRLLITSATLDPVKFSKFFFDCPTFHIPGRSFPVEINYAKKEHTFYVDAAVDAALQIHEKEEDGHVLVFLTGQKEIEEACKRLGELYDNALSDGAQMPDIVILPAYANLPAQKLLQIFQPAPPGCRKVIFCTNLCETSLTVPGVKYVIDPGFIKQMRYNDVTGIDALLVVNISRAAAEQRAGRAGRMSSGKCFRLYTKRVHDKDMDEETEPEIQRVNMCSTVLLLKRIGFRDVLRFSFLDRPSDESLVKALVKLRLLGALTKRGELTDIGKQIGEFPLDPAWGRFLIFAHKYGCLVEGLIITAMMSVDNVFSIPFQEPARSNAERVRDSFASKYGDPLTFLNVFLSYSESDDKKEFCQKNFLKPRNMKRVEAIREQLEEIAIQVFGEKWKVADNISKMCRKAMAQTFYMQAARKVSHSRGALPEYKPVDGKLKDQFNIHPNSSLGKSTPRWVVYANVTYTSRPFMSGVTSIKYEWIETLVSCMNRIDINELTNGSLYALQKERKEKKDKERLKRYREEVDKANAKAAMSVNENRTPTELGDLLKKKTKRTFMVAQASSNDVNDAKARYLARMKKMGRR